MSPADPASVFKRISLILIAVAAVSGTLISARAFFGPFHFLAQINRPLNLESIFGLSATVALLCRMKRDDIPGNTPAKIALTDVAYFNASPT